MIRDDDEFSVPFCGSLPCPLCRSSFDPLDCLAVIFQREKRERLKNATASNVELVTRTSYNHPRRPRNAAP